MRGSGADMKALIEIIKAEKLEAKRAGETSARIKFSDANKIIAALERFTDTEKE